MEKTGNTPVKKRPLTPFQITMGALYVALFALASNVPFLSSIQFIPGVAITLQIFLVAMMGLTLGLKGGMVTYIAVLVLTFCGLPLMSGGRGGPAVFVGPTSGYIYGMFFIVLFLGLYSSRCMDRLIRKKVWGMSVHVPVSFALGMLGVLFDYLCGSVGLALSAGHPLSEMPALLLSNLAFLPADIIKIGCASVLSLVLFAKPALVRMLKLNQVRT